MLGIPVCEVCVVSAHLDPVLLGVHRVSSSKDLLLTGLASLSGQSIQQAVCVGKVGVGAYMQRGDLFDCQHLQVSTECGL